jgi:tripartite-type tricarboxylate transporter receptor subunit TctC
MHGMFADLPVVLPHVRGGRLAALGVTLGHPAPALPDVPTLAESGYPDVIAVNWFCLPAFMIGTSPRSSG